MRPERRQRSPRLRAILFAGLVSLSFFLPTRIHAQVTEILIGAQSVAVSSPLERAHDRMLGVAMTVTVPLRPRWSLCFDGHYASTRSAVDMPTFFGDYLVYWRDYGWLRFESATLGGMLGASWDAAVQPIGIRLQVTAGMELQREHHWFRWTGNPLGYLPPEPRLRAFHPWMSSAVLQAALAVRLGRSPSNPWLQVMRVWRRPQWTSDDVANMAYSQHGYRVRLGVPIRLGEDPRPLDREGVPMRVRIKQAVFGSSAGVFSAAVLFFIVERSDRHPNEETSPIQDYFLSGSLLGAPLAVASGAGAFRSGRFLRALLGASALAYMNMRIARQRTPGIYPDPFLAITIPLGAALGGG